MPGNMETKQLTGVIVGEAGSGKSSILMRFERNLFSDNFRTTIGISFISKTFSVSKTEVTMRIMDTAGQERFRKITSSHYRHADFVIIVYDVSNRGSFERVPSWIDEACEHAPEKAEILIIGNKCDSPTRRVSYAEGEELAKKYDLMFSETSAKTNINILPTFICLASKLLPEPTIPRTRSYETIKASKKQKLKKLSRKLRTSLHGYHLSPRSL